MQLKTLLFNTGTLIRFFYLEENYLNHQFYFLSLYLKSKQKVVMFEEVRYGVNLHFEFLLR